jgi:hypothetical protein
MPPNPWWIRVLDGGNARASVVAAVAFVIEFIMGKGDHRRADDYWKHKAQSYHSDNYGYGQRENHGKYTEREDERHQHRHGEGHER